MLIVCRLVLAIRRCVQFPSSGPLLDPAMGNALNPPTTFRDPCVFLDDDGEYYIIAGVFQ